MNAPIVTDRAMAPPPRGKRNERMGAGGGKSIEDVRPGTSPAPDSSGGSERKADA